MSKSACQSFVQQLTLFLTYPYTTESIFVQRCTNIDCPAVSNSIIEVLACYIIDIYVMAWLISYTNIEYNLYNT